MSTFGSEGQWGWHHRYRLFKELVSRQICSESKTAYHFQMYWMWQSISATSYATGFFTCVALRYLLRLVPGWTLTWRRHTRVKRRSRAGTSRWDQFALTPSRLQALCSRSQRPPACLPRTGPICTRANSKQCLGGPDQIMRFMCVRRWSTPRLKRRQSQCVKWKTYGGSISADHCPFMGSLFYVLPPISCLHHFWLNRFPLPSLHTQKVWDIWISGGISRWT